MPGRLGIPNLDCCGFHLTFWRNNGVCIPIATGCSKSADQRYLPSVVVGVVHRGHSRDGPRSLAAAQCRSGGGGGEGETCMAWGSAGVDGSGVRDGDTKVYLILLVLWKNGSGFGACTPINPKLCRSVRGWPSGPQEKKRSTKRSRSHSLVPTSAFVSIRDIRSARFSTAPDISPTKSGRTQGKGGYFSSLVSSILRSRDAARMKSGDADS